MNDDLALTADRITFGYSKNTPILEDWSQDFFAGEVVALTGASGRGKSTLLYVLGLMLQPTRGNLSVFGKPLNGAGDGERARLRALKYGFVFQDAALDATRTVLDNVVEGSLYRRTSRAVEAARAHELLEQFGVSLRADHKPGQVSGGQAQRISLCRSLLNDPRILLADEPTGNLDAKSSDVVIEALRIQARAGAAVIVATHDPRMVERCDREIAL